MGANFFLIFNLRYTPQWLEVVNMVKNSLATGTASFPGDTWPSVQRPSGPFPSHGLAGLQFVASVMETGKDNGFGLSVNLLSLIIVIANY